ncbi:MAG: hypothetical protein A3F43_02165 [Gammaproteobacteria bacterium RIFCSPHIGHO2_12_FULL_42_10]|nr:MAG: hypothetical protein A3F43_02165 [Gammaproteobacteria bacterium RIFCSPHIGHO2_12_FULL_42_10]
MTALVATKVNTMDEKPQAFAMKSGIALFSTSPNNVKAAGNFPPIRKILVAPGLPEPAVRGSGRCMRREMRIALDREPIR